MSLSDEDRDTIEQMKRERREIADVFERVAFDNGADGRSLVLHIIASLEGDE